MRTLRIRIGERLGELLSSVGRDDEAEEEFVNAAAVWEGEGVRYFHAWICYVKAKRVWSERRPAEALGWFAKARGLLDGTHGNLPIGVTAQDLAKLRHALDEHIEFLKGAKVEAIEPPGK